MTRMTREVEAMLVEALAAGLSHVDAAAAVGVSSKSVQRALSRHDFILRLAKRRAVKLLDFASRVETLEPDALNVLREAMGCDERRDRLRAATMWFALTARARIDFDVEVRLQALEAPNNPPGGHPDSEDDEDDEDDQDDQDDQDAEEHDHDDHDHDHDHDVGGEL